MRIAEPGRSNPSLREDGAPPALTWPPRPAPAAAAPHPPTAPRALDPDGFLRGGAAGWGPRATHPTATPRTFDDRDELRELRRELAKRAASAPSLEQRRAESRPAAPKAIGPKPEGRRAKADWYRAIVEQAGGEWRTGPDQVNIVGLRGQGVDGKRNHNTFNRWNDTIAYVWRDRAGETHVREFRATTDPGVKGGPGRGRDVDGNGSGDIAHLRPGRHPYRVGSHHGVYGAGNPTYDLRVDRDTNHDGQISRAERAASRRRDDRGYGINIHWGEGSVVGGWSEGCQVIEGSYDFFRRNVTPIMERNRGQMYYTLVDRSR
jgi:hypothetical protein